MTPRIQVTVDVRDSTGRLVQRRSEWRQWPADQGAASVAELAL